MQFTVWTWVIIGVCVAAAIALIFGLAWYWRTYSTANITEAVLKAYEKANPTETRSNVEVRKIAFVEYADNNDRVYDIRIHFKGGQYAGTTVDLRYLFSPVDGKLMAIDTQEAPKDSPLNA